MEKKDNIVSTIDQEELLYVFISIDLVNSTAYKYKYPQRWPKVFHDFYMKSTEYLSNFFVHSELKVWKSLGDEILFYVTIKNRTEMYKLLEYVDNTLVTLQDFLSKDDSIQVRASVWIADIIEYNEGIKDYNNVSFSSGVHKEYQSLDFIGSDIDTGFRLSKYVTKGRIVICAKIAYILCKMNCPDECEHNISKHLKIVGYVKLKGVWNNRAYPIIWYCKDWKNIVFDYDEHMDSNVVDNIKYNRIENISELGKVLADLGKKGRCDKLYNLFITTMEKKTEPSHELIENSEFDMVAIVLNRDTKKVFMVKRTNRTYLNDIWEFGSSLLTSNETFEETIKKTYKKEFNITIDFIEDKSTIATFSLDKKDNSVKQGIIFYTETNLSEDIKLIEDKYSEYKWLSMDEVAIMDDNEMVENAKENIQIAFDQLEERSKTSN